MFSSWNILSNDSALKTLWRRIASCPDCLDDPRFLFPKLMIPHRFRFLLSVSQTYTLHHQIIKSAFGQFICFPGVSTRFSPVLQCFPGWLQPFKENTLIQTVCWRCYAGFKVIASWTFCDRTAEAPKVVPKGVTPAPPQRPVACVLNYVETCKDFRRSKKLICMLMQDQATYSRPFAFLSCSTRIDPRYWTVSQQSVSQLVGRSVSQAAS